jgi:hypothetical protein
MAANINRRIGRRSALWVAVVACPHYGESAVVPRLDALLRVGAPNIVLDDVLTAVNRRGPGLLADDRIIGDETAVGHASRFSGVAVWHTSGISGVKDRGPDKGCDARHEG